MVYLECVCKVFHKYRVTFRLDKCDFLKERVEYVRHDVTEDGNCPAQSKFYLINDWKLPINGKVLFSFTGLMNFYHIYAPYFKIRMNPLHKLLKHFYRNPIPLMDWTPSLIELFDELEKVVTSSLLLEIFDHDKPTLLATDWIAEVMGWILMQHADDEESQQSVKILRETGECLFDLSKNGARLRPLSFGS